MQNTYSISPASASWGTLTFHLFGAKLRSLWMLILILTVSVEIIPIPQMPPVSFYLYCSLKALLFVTLGYLAPLAFWRFHTMNSLLAMATLSAVAVETLQLLLAQGQHRFHFYEVVAKLVLIGIGFGAGIVAHYDGQILIGRFRIILATAEH